MQAYLNVDAGADAPTVRTRLQAAGSTPAKEHEALLAVESQIEQAVRDVLAGGTPDLRRCCGGRRNRPLRSSRPGLTGT